MRPATPGGHEKSRPRRGGAGNETRTRDPDLGKVVLYQLSYSGHGVEQAQQGHHLHHGLDLADRGHLHRGALAELGHPLAQRGHGDLAAHDHRRPERHPRRGVALHDQEQRGGHHQLVGHRIEEGAEGRAHAVAARDPAVEPVGDGGQGEHAGGREVAPLPGQVEREHQHRDQDDAQQGQPGGERQFHAVPGASNPCSVA